MASAARTWSTWHVSMRQHAVQEGKHLSSTNDDTRISSLPSPAQSCNSILTVHSVPGGADAASFAASASARLPSCASTSSVAAVAVALFLGVRAAVFAIFECGSDVSCHELQFNSKTRVKSNTRRGICVALFSGSWQPASPPSEVVLMKPCFFILSIEL